jgi:uncharacterized SAM-binding protein YcdF (DUF218 family)
VKGFKRFCRLFCGVLLVLNLGVGLLIFTPLQNSMYSLLEVPANPQAADVVLLLSGGDFRFGQFESKTYQRMQQAKSLYDQGLADKILICGGVLRPGEEAISRKMAAYLASCGVAEENILLEEKSRNTHENILFAKNVLGKEQLSSVLLVTSSSHMWRSLKICQKQGLEVFPAPVPCYEKHLKSAAERWYHLREILREYGAIVYFKLRGWI